MSLATRIEAFIQALGPDIKALFIRAPGVGGATGQVWMKNSATDHDASWQTPPSGGGGGFSQKRPHLWN